MVDSNNILAYGKMCTHVHFICGGTIIIIIYYIYFLVAPVHDRTNFPYDKTMWCIRLGDVDSCNPTFRNFHEASARVVYSYSYRLCIHKAQCISHRKTFAWNEKFLYIWINGMQSHGARKWEEKKDIKGKRVREGGKRRSGMSEWMMNFICTKSQCFCSLRWNLCIFQRWIHFIQIIYIYTIFTYTCECVCVCMNVHIHMDHQDIVIFLHLLEKFRSSNGIIKWYHIYILIFYKVHKNTHVTRWEE